MRKEVLNLTICVYTSREVAADLLEYLVKCAGWWVKWREARKGSPGPTLQDVNDSLEESRSRLAEQRRAYESTLYDRGFLKSVRVKL